MTRGNSVKRFGIIPENEVVSVSSPRLHCDFICNCIPTLPEFLQLICSVQFCFRVNKALRKGHELDVGNRTTHYFFFDRSLRETSESDVPNDQVSE